jgi:hypothetical protein
MSAPLRLSLAEAISNTEDRQCALAVMPSPQNGHIIVALASITNEPSQLSAATNSQNFSRSVICYSSASEEI